MIQLLMRWLTVTVVAFITGLFLHFSITPAVSAAPPANPTSAQSAPREAHQDSAIAPQEDPSTIATAPQPPNLVPAKLGGKPVHVLYMTRSGDTVIVRCYPTESPTLTVRPMGGQPDVKEGVLTCKSGQA